MGAFPARRHKDSMDMAGGSSTIRFGVFDLDLRTGELRKAGRKLRIQEQPLCVLVALLERPGELVTRGELRRKLWPSDTFVDFDTGLNKAITKIREVLADSAASPRFVETLPKRGYRFIAPIEKPSPEQPDQTADQGAKRAARAPAIAVLPFANVGTDKEDECFSDGLSDEIINALTKVPGLRVIARTSAFRFRGEQDRRKIGEALHVSTVLEGSVRRAANRLRITAQLVDVADDSYIWSERYDREMTDVFAIQDEISAAIVDQLKVSLGGHLVARRPLPNLAAYEAVLEGRHHWFRFTPAELAKALECFERAVAIDPKYAEAHVGIAHYYVQMAGLSLAEPRKVLPWAKAAAERAIEVDPTLAQAYAALAQVVLWFDHAWPEAERHFRRALALAPAGPLVHIAYGALYLRPSGRLREALAEIDCALEHDPLSPLYRAERAVTLLYEKRYYEAAESFQRALDIDANFFLAVDGLALMKAYQQRFEESLALANQLIQVHGRRSRPLTLLGIVYSLAGQTGEAHRVLDELRQLGSREYVPAGRVAGIYTALGEADAAFEWAAKAVQQRDPTILWIRASPVFDGLRADPRFPALLREVNLA
jgi:TolB-like protein/Tfp pilus assembly protein PilF